MEKRSLGSKGPEISVVGYGAWEAGGDFWGPNESDDGVVAAIHTGLEAGMTWIDTAEVYGKGRSEQLVARAIQGRRDELLLFTKVAPGSAGSGLRPEQVKGAIRGSLERLGTDHVDLYQIHWPDDAIPIEETWGAMAEIQDDGLALHIGLSNFDRDRVTRCDAIRHVDSLQNEFSLLHQEDRHDLLPALDGMGVGYLAYSPMAMGMLTGAIRPGHHFDPRDFRSGSRGEAPEYFRPGELEANAEKVGRLRKVAERLDASLAAVAIRWVLEQRGVTTAIAGSRNPDHTRGNAVAGELHVDADALAEIDAIFG